MGRVAFAGLLCAVLCYGCSLKEDRSGCPFRLVLDFSGVDTSVVRSANLFLVAEGGFAFDDELSAGDFRTGVDVAVPRERLDIGVWSAEGWGFSGDGMSIPVGLDCPEVYFHLSSVEAEGEAVHDTVRMKKNHCVMSLRLSGLVSEPVRIGILGKVDGYMRDGSPSMGEFYHEMELEGEGRVVLPRQVDNSLVMEVYDEAGVVRRFAVGEYIAESGYDWEDADLKDITLEMDVAVTGVRLLVQGCEDTFEFEIEI